MCGVEYHHADEDFEAAFSPGDIEEINDLEDLCSDDEGQEGEDSSATPEELYRPFAPQEPSLSPDELAELDALSEWVCCTLE